MIRKRPVKAFIVGCAGTELTPTERELFHTVNPLGLILFDRNVQNPEQLKALVADFRKTVGRPNAPILVDQEGGRVQRLWPPYWTGLGWADTYGEWYLENAEKGISAVQEHARLLGADLASAGININCWPCLDVSNAETHIIMKKRCFSDNPDVVGVLGRVAVEAALENGFMPVVKHIPGYGRTKVDPHSDLPVVNAPLKVLEKNDFKPFVQISKPVWGMTAHVVYTALDKKLPATLSSKVIDYIRTEIGFDGFLVCDDILMGSLQSFGTLGELSAKMIAAGCDAVLYCGSDADEIVEIANNVPILEGKSLKRLKQAEACLK